ncbi:MAG: sugar ABC transporter ATP-binding protein [Firmicutes bacterium]|nr:sugar ABC transporter ATP-binding protein [Bacillota bacterium]
MSDYILELIDINKSFPGVQALKDANLKLRAGSVHALMGENGAGKSTLMKCLFGIYKLDTGQIIYDGNPISITSPNEALKLGIAMVHQELQPIPERSIAENIFCGRYLMTAPHLLVNHRAMYDQAKQVLESLGLDFDPKTLLKNLSVSQMQLVEIAKAVSFGAKIVIMDEPPSSLTQTEVDILFSIIRKLTERGCAVIYISHKMDEILRVSDEVTIMRDGQYIGTWKSSELTTNFIITKMVGREMTNIYPAKHNVPGETVLEISDFTSVNPRSFKNAGFTLRRGEILGVAGLVGAQRTELMEGIFGLRGKTSGKIRYLGHSLTVHKPEDAIKNKIALLTEDRRGSGIMSVLSVADNISVASLSKFRLFKVFLNISKINELVMENVNKLSIKTPSIRTLIKSLSGGNQQKVIVSRWLANDPDIFIMDEPTRGIDVGAKYEIYSIIADLTANGKSVIMISSEMPELIGMADRIMVMCDGRVTGFVEGADINQELIMDLATRFNPQDVYITQK